MANTVIRKFENSEALSRAAAEYVCEIAADSVKERGIFTFVLSGGKSPQGLYRKLSSDFRERMPWERTHIFFGDERFVPRDHPDSNFKMAFDLLLSKVLPPERNIHAIPVGVSSPDESASLYDDELRYFFNDDPIFDLVLLGVGADGHTASLFPGDPTLDEDQHFVSAVAKPGMPPGVPRVTLTFPSINRSRHVAFLVAGTEKMGIAREIVDRRKDVLDIYPAARVVSNGSVIWFAEG